MADQRSTRSLISEWWQKRGLWMVGDVLMIAIGAAMVVASIAHFFD
jgi:hypothetical protein